MNRGEGEREVSYMAKWEVVEMFMFPTDEEFRSSDPVGYEGYCRFVRGMFDELRCVHKDSSSRVLERAV